MGTGLESAGASRRTVRLEGEPVPPGRLADLQRQVWLTPAQDRLFLEGAGDRRRFFDRLVFAATPAHAAHANAYEKAQRERMRLLSDGPADPAWLSALEARMAESGALMAEARARTLAALQEEIDAADAMIGSLVVPPIGGGSLSTDATSALTEALADYNEGATGPGHCEDE